MAYHLLYLDDDNLVFLNQFIFSNTLEHISFKYQLLKPEPPKQSRIISFLDDASSKIS